MDKPKATTPKDGKPRAPSKPRSDIWVRPILWKDQNTRNVVVEVRKRRRPAQP